MPLLVELRRENGEVLARAGEHGTNSDGYLPDFMSSDFPMLRFIDPYGKTVFNGQQIELVIPELLRLKDQARSSAQARMIEGIIEPCEEMPRRSSPLPVVDR